jgi:phosphoglycolate phosphatase-like HAD superfamily hydrolase
LIRAMLFDLDGTLFDRMTDLGELIQLVEALS